MEITLTELESRFLDSFAAFKAAALFYRKEKKNRLLSQVDMLARSEEGLSFLYQHIPQLNEAGLFVETPWEAPEHLVPSLVGGTLLSGYPNSTMELMSELRVLALKEFRLNNPHFSSGQAESFLQDVMVANFELAFEDFSQPAWSRYPPGELRKIQLLFLLLRKHISVDSLKGKIREEVEVLSAHRPIVATKMKRMLRLAYEKIQLNPAEDHQLLEFVHALYQPTDETAAYNSPEAYRERLKTADKATLREECRQIGAHMSRTGLVSEYQLLLLQHLVEQEEALVPTLLDLNAHGQAEYERHHAFVLLLIQQFIVSGNKQAIYGLARVLQRNLLSRKTTWNAFNRLVRLEIHPEVAQNLTKGNLSKLEVSPMQLLVGGILCVLGQPLGVRQGNNPTCQSARGISMWSRHAPGKLINMLIDATATNNVVFRYEGELIESAAIAKGLTQQFDYKLDPVSIVLVPHLDKIYNEMMKRATVKHPGIDPHISVNPAFYGHWIQTGFLSVYNPLKAAIENFEAFVRIFYASFHLAYNGGHRLIYPVPLGIFITDSTGSMLGYHAISLLRIEQAPEGEWRAYFFNPNSEGKQNWGQGIEPSVFGHGELFGESSLPVHQFVSRVYAYHYNKLRLEKKDDEIPAQIVSDVENLARQSWGRKYVWL